MYEQGGGEGSVVWSAFRARYQADLERWVAAERRIHTEGPRDAAGEALLAAEAALQRLIVDFAVLNAAEEDPTAVALELLRHAEAHLREHPGPGRDGLTPA
jgi:hypothetical protein